MSHARTRQMRLLRPLVESRAAGQCEMERCPFPGDELHHVLPRARARRADSHILDAWAAAEVKAGAHPDLPWLALLCAKHHDLAHANPSWAYSIGLLVRGEVRTGLDGQPEYRGSSTTLAVMFPVREVSA